MFALSLVSIVHLILGFVPLYTAQTTQKLSNLNAQITSQNGASVIHNDVTSTISGTNYNIMLDSEDNDIGYDLKLSLNKSWSYHPSVPSSIILTMNGTTPYPDKDTDLMLVFSVNDWQYFSLFVHLDYTYNIKSRIYPCISMANISTSVSEWISNTNIVSRWDRISNDDQWEIMHDWNRQVLWPLKFIITNNPIQNKIIFQMYHNTSQTYATGYIFENNIFIPNKSIDIYVMGDSVGEQMTISSFNVQLNYNQSNQTNTPTTNPTIYESDEMHETSTSYPIYLIGDKPETDYGISMIIGFKYTFSVIDMNKITTIIQHFIISENDDCKEMVKQTIITKANVTIINATIYLCDQFAQNELLIAANDGNLQRDIIGNINKEIQHIEIMENKTWVQANSINNIVFPNSTETINGVNTNYYISKKSFMDYYTFWLIIFITIPIIACCSFLTYLKRSTEKKRAHAYPLKYNQSEIQKHINLTTTQSTLHISKIEESYDNDALYPMRKNSSKIYKIRKYNKPKTHSVASVSIPSTNTNKSNQLNVLSTSPVSPRLYKTRGVSEDIYDQNNSITPNEKITNDEMYSKGVITLDTLQQMSAASQISSYPNVSVPISPDQTVYQLPKDQITKRQWL